MMKRMSHLACNILLIMTVGASLVACKKKTKNPPPLTKSEVSKALKKKTCATKSANDSMAIPDAGELYNLVSKMGLGQSIVSAVSKKPVKLATASGNVTAYVLGLALAEQTLIVSSGKTSKALPRLKTIYKKAKAAHLLDKASQTQVDGLLKKLAKVKKTSDFRSFLSLVRAEFLKRMREKKHRYNAMLVLAGGLLLSYHEISQAASLTPKAGAKVGEILSFTDPIQLLTNELGTCFASNTIKDAKLQKVVLSLQKLEKLLSRHKGKFVKKTYQSIATITGEALQTYR